ncbi:MAG: 5'-nucleotidase C-terminal domain-containing protein [Oscillospiraceae bacterium]|nr:5'-nucleotidase C-terminal domain-containing protein [Oscillospiraceae bacterium]
MAVKTIDILGHADFGGSFRKCRRAPGLAAFYAAVRSVRSKNPDGTLLLDAGDNFCRQLWNGAEVAEGLALIGTDAMTLGNHEFDFGRDFLERAIAASRFPVLCANVREKETGLPVRGTAPTALFERRGIRIGVVGVTTEYTPYMVEASAFAPYAVSSAADACRKHIPALRDAGAQIVVVLAHEPFYIGENGVSGELIDLLSALGGLGVDAMIGGHIPGDYAGVVGGTAVVKGGFGGVSLPHIALDYDTGAGRVTARRCEVIDVAGGACGENSEAVGEFVRRVTGPYDYFFTEPLGTLTADMPMRLSAESPLGDFFADCVRETAGTQFAYMNATSAGRALAAGTLTRESVLDAMGFNDPILTARATGAQLRALFELVYEPARFGNNAGLIHAGFTAEIDNAAPAGRKVVSLRLPDGAPIERDAVYTVATSRYMASGGNDTGSCARALAWHDTGVKMNDSLFANIRARGTIEPPAPGRLVLHGRPENDNAPY